MHRILVVTVLVCLIDAGHVGSSPLVSAGCLMGGASYSRTFDGAPHPSRGPLESGWGWALTGFAEWSFPWLQVPGSERWQLGLLTEVGWLEKSVTQQSSSGTQIHVKDDYLSIPIVLKLGFIPGAFQPYAVLGASMEYRLTERERGSVSIDPSRWAPALQVGGGTVLHERFDLRLTYAHDLRDSSGYNTAPALDSVRNSGLTLVCGVRFPL